MSAYSKCDGTRRAEIRSRRPTSIRMGLLGWDDACLEMRLHFHVVLLFSDGSSAAPDGGCAAAGGMLGGLVAGLDVALDLHDVLRRCVG